MENTIKEQYYLLQKTVKHLAKKKGLTPLEFDYFYWGKETEKPEDKES